MLSKVAERVYWSARYLERVESTARIVQNYDMLLFDLPNSVKLSWYNLVDINDQHELFESIYSLKTEQNVVEFTLGNLDNYASIASSLRFVRENIRTTRDVIPAETWELVNELSLYVDKMLPVGVHRAHRREFLDNIIKGCQQILGIMYGNMPHDKAWTFLRLGRNLERADMTSRNLDAGMAAVMEAEKEPESINSRQIIWGNILRSLNADQSYRRAKRSAVRGDLVISYLLFDEAFPRSISHCHDAILNSCEKLPNAEQVKSSLEEVQYQLKTDAKNIQPGIEVRNHLNQIQIYHATIHNTISEAWFPRMEQSQEQKQS